MAEELVGVMDKLGFPTFTLIGHDRGGRVSYRMALDHSKHGAVRFLRDCEADGMKFENCPAYVREWMDGEED